MEILELEKVNIDEINMKKWEVLDQNGSTVFSLDNASWSLRDRVDGSEVLSGSGVVDNADQDRAGNTIKTVSITLDTRVTDLTEGMYYLILFVQLSTQQSKFFRIPIEMVDIREAA